MLLCPYNFFVHRLSSSLYFVLAVSSRPTHRLKDVLRISAGRLLALQGDLSSLLEHLQRPSALGDDLDEEQVEEGESSSEESDRDDKDDDAVREEKSRDGRSQQVFRNRNDSDLQVKSGHSHHKAHHPLASALLRRLQGLHQQLDELLDGMRNDVEVLVQLSLDRSKIIANHDS